jgi:hypothetical protein
VALNTVSAVKTALGITGSSEDTALATWLAQATALIRRETGKFLGGMISANTVANPTVVTSVGHGLETGDLVYFSHSDSTPTLNGEQTVTRTGRDTFTVAVNVTVVGTVGGYAKKFIEYYRGDGSSTLLLNQTPVLSIASVYEDAAAYYGESSDPFPATTLLTEGTDYVLQRDMPTSALEYSKTGILHRIGSRWACSSTTSGGLLTAIATRGLGNIKTTYYGGYADVPYDLQFATAMLVAVMRSSAQVGGQLVSESLDYYSYTRASSSEVTESMASIDRTLRRYKEPVW